MANFKKVTFSEIIKYILISIVLIAFSYFLTDLVPGISEFATIFRIILGYVALIILSKTLQSSKHYYNIYKVIHFPRLFYNLVLKAYYKIYLAGTMSLMVVGAVIYLGLLYIPERIFDIDINFVTKAYIVFTLFSIIFRVFAEKIFLFTGKLHFKKENEKEHYELMVGMINNERIRYVLYFFYFFVLIIFSYMKFMAIDLFKHQNIQDAMLSSFATFIAFDRLVLNRALVSVNMRTHWEKLIKVHDKDPKYAKDKNYLRQLKISQKNINSKE